MFSNFSYQISRKGVWREIQDGIVFPEHLTRKYLQINWTEMRSTLQVESEEQEKEKVEMSRMVLGDDATSGMS